MIVLPAISPAVFRVSGAVQSRTPIITRVLCSSVSCDLLLPTQKGAQ